MADDQFQCPECHVTSGYYETRKTLDPRMLPKARTICQDCADRIEPQAASFTVEANFRKAGPSAQAAKGAAKDAKMSDIHRHIWRYLRDHPATPGEVFTALSPIHGKKLNTYRARITDLKDEGWIYDTGNRRETTLETTATVWAVSERKAA